MNKYLFILLVLFSIFNGCKKNSKAPLPDPIVPDYLPIAAGNTWTYAIGHSNDTIVVKMTGETMVKNGITYYVASVTPAFFGHDKFYYSHNGKIYSMLTTLDEIGVSNVYTDLTILDPIWTEGGHLTYENHLTDSVKGVSMESESFCGEAYSKSTLNGINYDHVVTTGVDIQAYLNGEYKLFKTYSFYMAPNVGIIAETIFYSAENTIDLTLVNYKVAAHR